MKTIYRLAPVFWLAIFVLTACSQAAPEPVSFDIHMSEYAFEPADIEVQVGQQVTLNLINDGVLEHEIMFGREVMMMENRPSGYQQDMFEVAGIEPEVMQPEAAMESMEEEDHAEEHSGFMVILPHTGDTATLTFTANEAMEGEWEMGCFEQDGVHYTAGMVGSFTVLR